MAVKIVFILIAAAVNVLAGASEPGDAAVGFLEKVRAKSTDLSPGKDTALSPQTSEAKRKEIARRLERMAYDLGDESLEVGAVKMDEDLAAVMVRKTGSFDLSRLQVFPVALVKRGAAWLAAPVAASFENTGQGYDAARRQRLAALEDWMLSERSADLEKLREQSTATMRHKIEQALPAEKLRGMSSAQVAESFLAACEHGNLQEIIGLLGGLSANLPPDWSLRLKSAERATAKTAALTRPWRMLVSPAVLRVPVSHDEDKTVAISSIACLDPAGGNASPARDSSRDSKTPVVELLHLELSKTSDGFWRIDLPASLTQDVSEISSEIEPPLDSDENPDELDSDLLDLFAEKLALKYPCAPEPTANRAKDAILAAFSEERATSWARRLMLDDSPAKTRSLCARAAQIWWESRRPGAAGRLVSLAFHEENEMAIAACQLFDARNPERPNLKFLFFKKSPTGWFWDPAPSEKSRKSLSFWTDQQTTKWPETWQRSLLIDSLELENIPATEPPSQNESRMLVEAWITAMRAGNVVDALRLTAHLKIPDSKSLLLRNLGYEISGAFAQPENPAAPSIIAIRRAQHWATATVQNPTTAGKHSFPLYPIISTTRGPRILLEVDLLSSSSRGRDFLNKTTLNRLNKFQPKAADELKEMFTAHANAVKELIPH